MANAISAPRETIIKADREEVVNAIREWANCTTAVVTDDGSIWIEGPQVGHWLKSNELEELAIFLS